MDPTNDVIRRTLEIRTGQSMTIEDIQEIVFDPPHFYSKYNRLNKQTCLNCGKLFFPRNFHSKQAKFCCHQCYLEFRRNSSVKHNPNMTKPDGINRLSPDEAHMQELLGRYLTKHEYVYRFGPGKDDLRLLSRSDKGKMLHNENLKYRLVDDGDYCAHAEFDPNNPNVRTCDECGSLFYIGTNPDKARKYCSYECSRAARSRLASQKDKYRKIYNNSIGAKDNPNATARGVISEHRLMAQKLLGRPLRKSEVVHHMDGNTMNNTEGNIIVFNHSSDHARWHAYGSLGSQLVQLPNGSYATVDLKQIVDIDPNFKKS